MQPLISVVVPVYNVEKYLSECIESILNQTYRNLEIILVDDGSTDSSGKICEVYKKQSSLISVIHMVNNGQAAARNVGIKHAKGEYITFVDSDDVISPNMIMSLYENVIGFDMSMCGNIKFEVKLPESIDEGKKRRIKTKEYFRQLLTNPDYVVVWGKLYKKEVIDQTLFKEGMIHEDEEFMPRLISKIHDICVDSRQLYFYRVRPNSTMTSAFSPQRLDVIIACQRRIDLLKKLGYKSLYRQAVIDYYIHLQRLLKMTESAFYEKEHALVQQKLEAWKKYNVRLTFWEKRKFGICKRK